ncbi:protein NO VEIN-like [Rhodamnia argentea]|uniref:Protein NO VEIN-like n=1 Tax=Rhodamnia argentea TaxID=178133 RepID=A0A8B8PIY9_9MYRT|nr:protein NO VEIN-like [Rhodamnia argentea]
MLEDVYDAIDKQMLNGITLPIPLPESKDRQSSLESATDNARHSAEHTTGVIVEDIAREIGAYYQLDHEKMSNNKSVLEMKVNLLRKLVDCDSWLAKQFSVHEFESLGHGEFFSFLAEHISLMPAGLKQFLIGDNEKSHFEVCVLQHQLMVLISQALSSLWNGEVVTKEMISTLLLKQFPMLNFKTEVGSLEDFLNIVGEYRGIATSKCLLFSQTLMGTHGQDVLALDDDYSVDLETIGKGTDVLQKIGKLESVSSKDAIEVLLRAPMLSDLSRWSHWDIKFAPCLGPLVGWLLNEVNRTDLLCLLTKDGKVIRVDSSASVDSFLQCALQSSPFQTAVQLLSLFSILGGQKHVPLSLLKCHARRAFEVILNDHLENKEVTDSWNFHMPEKAACTSKLLDEVCTSRANKNSTGMCNAVLVASRYFLECLSYIPSEFRSFAADVLLSGMRSVIKHAPLAILSECRLMEERIMLHEVGLYLCVVEWIDDYHVFCSYTDGEMCKPSEAPSFKAETSKPITDSLSPINKPQKSFPAEEDKTLLSLVSKGQSDINNEVCRNSDSPEVCMDKSLAQNEPIEYEDACSIVESIRREEFGFDPNLSSTESSLLKKQHARLGRALRCLSQELYSQDSHFLLELVQNADDNTYLENVEPALVFILQESGITILNNERGFSAQDIRALCDVGNSTKKGSAGYIGKKGIGFKSVFRVTDAPEIHSNGFHVKFDISEGQIGFVLPTVIPPLDHNVLRKLTSANSDQFNTSCWKTCIVLPFRLDLLEGTGRNNVISMFSDIHPALLLFLHRLRCIIFRNMHDDSLIVMRKETCGNGIIRVSYGKEEMNWFVACNKLHGNIGRSNVQTTEISLAFGLKESTDGNYIPCLDMQPVFAFLPLRTYGLKFILQGDFVLPSSREEVDGDNPWNQWLLSEFPDLFVKAEGSFCSLPCFRDNLGKAVTAYMSYVPLVGEVHGFFSCLPRMIISKLRHSNCLILEGDDTTWAPPCKVVRGWNEEARVLLPDLLLQEHLGLGFLKKDISLSDPLARTLGVEEYGPKLLLQIITSLCHKKDSLPSMGLSWLSAWLNAVYKMYEHSLQASRDLGMGRDIIEALRKLPFIPLSDGTFGSVDEGMIWLHLDGSGNDSEQGMDDFPMLYVKLRIVNPTFLTALDDDIYCADKSSKDNIIRILLIVGVQRLSTHEIMKVHVLPSICDDKSASWNNILMTEFLCFVFIHLQSSCPSCHVERDFLISELRNRAFILTNQGKKRPIEVPVHYGKEFGSSFDLRKLFNNIQMEWHEVDSIYLKHSSTKSVVDGKQKWKRFFEEIGITEFVHVVKVDRRMVDMPDSCFGKAGVERDHMPSKFVAEDWESTELDHLLSLVSASGNRVDCKFLLEVFDKLWDDCFSDKTTGYFNNEYNGNRTTFRSSFLNSICGVPWVVSCMDDKLHYPKDLFYDCDAVHSILGSFAPYAVPKVRSVALLHDIEFKTRVTIEDVVELLRVWRRSETSFKSSVAQMSKLYTFLWKEVDTSKKNILEDLISEPFIFFPSFCASAVDDVVLGSFLLPKEVCWHDSPELLNQMEEIDSESGAIGAKHSLLSRTLCNIYPGLRDFFVNICGVYDVPSFRNHFQNLLHLSTTVLPSQAAKYVFKVFLKLVDELKRGKVSLEDTLQVSGYLKQSEYTVLPTLHNRWVSLHPSFGLVCWCDDEKLMKEFGTLDKIELLYFGELVDDEKEMIYGKLPLLMHTLGVPAFSEVVTREAIYYGPMDSSSKASFVNWILPYAQRYIYHEHPNTYANLKQSGFSNLSHLHVVVVERLYYRNIIRDLNIASEKRLETESILQGNTLFVTPESDSHALSMEISRPFFNGTPNTHLANFLHMITTMAESGSSEDQLESFIIKSQKVPNLPGNEPVWALSSISLCEDDGSLENSSFSATRKVLKSFKAKRRGGVTSSWPPSDWKSAPGSVYSPYSQVKTQAVTVTTSTCSRVIEDDCRVLIGENDGGHEVCVDLTTEDVATASSIELSVSDRATDVIKSDSCVDISPDQIDMTTMSNLPDLNLPQLIGRTMLNISMPDPEQAMLVGKLGELIVFRHLAKKLSQSSVKWVNEDGETGLPYDITVEDGEGLRYIEVKTTQSEEKDWFSLSTNEWQFADQKGRNFSIAHVILVGHGRNKIRMFPNPVELCRSGKLQLAIVMPSQL